MKKSNVFFDKWQGATANDKFDLLNRMYNNRPKTKIIHDNKDEYQALFIKNEDLAPVIESEKSLEKELQSNSYKSPRSSTPLPPPSLAFVKAEFLSKKFDLSKSDNEIVHQEKEPLKTANKKSPDKKTQQHNNQDSNKFDLKNLHILPS